MRVACSLFCISATDVLVRMLRSCSVQSKLGADDVPSFKGWQPNLRRLADLI
jgi:hypothetical protein